jgi:hypothetical protein
MWAEVRHHFPSRLPDGVAWVVVVGFAAGIRYFGHAWIDTIQGGLRVTAIIAAPLVALLFHQLLDRRPAGIGHRTARLVGDALGLVVVWFALTLTTLALSSALYPNNGWSSAPFFAIFPAAVGLCFATFARTTRSKPEGGRLA